MGFRLLKLIASNPLGKGLQYNVAFGGNVYRTTYFGPHMKVCRLPFTYPRPTNVMFTSDSDVASMQRLCCPRRIRTPGKLLYCPKVGRSLHVLGPSGQAGNMKATKEMSCRGG